MMVLMMKFNKKVYVIPQEKYESMVEVNRKKSSCEPGQQAATDACCPPFETQTLRVLLSRLQFGEVLSLKTVGGPLATEIHPQSRSHRSFLKLEIVEMSTRQNPLTARYTAIRLAVCAANATSQY